MKIDYHYPGLGLWVTLWAEKPGGCFDDLWWTQKEKLKQDIFLAVSGVLGKGDVPASAADLGRGHLDCVEAQKRKSAQMPDGDDGHVGE